MEFSNWLNRFIWHLYRSQDVKRVWVFVDFCFFFGYLLLLKAAGRASLSSTVVQSPLFERNQAGLMVFCQNLLCFTLLFVSEPIVKSSLWGLSKANNRGSGGFWASCVDRKIH